MIGKVIEGRYVGSGVYKLPEKNVLFIQAEDGTKIAISKNNVISIDDITEQYLANGNKVMMVMWNDFETSIIQYGVHGLAPKQEIPNIVNHTVQVDKVFHSGDKIDTTVAPKRKVVNKKIAIRLAIIVAVVATAFVVFQISEFERVKSKVVDICPVSSSGKGNFSIDTRPDHYTEEMILYLAPQDDALKGIQYANEALGFNGALYSKMLETNSLMGRQSEENRKYKVSWSYHPDDGLEVIYEKK